MTKPYTPDEARGVALGIREEGIFLAETWDEDEWEVIAVTLERYAEVCEGEVVWVGIGDAEIQLARAVLANHPEIAKEMGLL